MVNGYRNVNRGAKRDCPVDFRWFQGDEKYLNVICLFIDLGFNQSNFIYLQWNQNLRREHEIDAGISLKFDFLIR